MKNPRINHYEKAFANFLVDNHIQFTAIDERKRSIFGRSKIKSFDYLLYPPNQPIIVAEVKGRKFKGTSFAKLAGFDCLVTVDDVAGLIKWQKVFGQTHTAAFIFAYKIENIDVDLDGRDVYYFDGYRYVFFCIRLSDYRKFMKIRSPKWGTVTLPAEKFRQCTVQIQQLFA